jgi:hypothetical protein
MVGFKMITESDLPHTNESLFTEAKDVPDWNLPESNTIEYVATNGYKIFYVFPDYTVTGVCNWPERTYAHNSDTGWNDNPQRRCNDITGNERRA